MPRFSTAVAAALLIGVCGCAASSPTARPSPRTTPRVVPAVAQPTPQAPVVGVKVDQFGTGWLDVTDYNYSGFDVDIAGYLSRQLFDHQDPYFLPVSSSTRETALTDGAVRFFVATYTIDQGREAKFDLAGPYLVTAQGVMVGPHSPPISSLSDLDGKTVCVVGNGSESEEILEERVPQAIPEPEPDYSDCLRDLRDNNVQAFSTDLAILYGYMEQPGSSGLRVVPGVTMGNLIFYGVAFRKSDRALCLAAALQIKALVDSNQWDTYFTTDLPDYAAGVPDYATEVKPTDQEINDNSCKN